MTTHLLDEKPAIKRASDAAIRALTDQLLTNRSEKQDGLLFPPIETDDQLRAYMAQRFGVHIPDVQVCPNHSTPWRAFAEAYFARAPISVWKASRGLGGKSYLLAALGKVEAETLGAEVKILGGSGEQAKRVHESMQEFWRHPLARRDLLASDPTQRSTRLTNGGLIEALLASQASVRGPHPQRFRGDEIDEMVWEILEAARGMPQDGRGILSQTVLSSTHQYELGTMTRVLEEAEKCGWPVHEWCHRESMAGPDAWLTEATRQHKRETMSAEAWDVEVELQRPNAEAKAIQRESVERMFRSDLGSFQGENGQYIEIEGPQPGASYVHGADWARSQDWTIVTTWRTDLHPIRLVAFERRGRADWPQMTALLDERQRHYGGRAKHDGTGIGDVIDQFLQVPAEGVWMAGHVRQELFAGYVMAIEDGRLVAPNIEWMRTEHLRCTQDDLYGAGHPPDSVVSGALATSLAMVPGARFVALGSGNGAGEKKTPDPDRYDKALAERLRRMTTSAIGRH